MAIKKVYNLFVMNKIKFCTPLTILITFVFLITSFSSDALAGGGPQFVCKDMAQKQGWLIDNTKFDEELSENACVSRKPTPQEKDEILEFCKSEPKGEFRDDCLNKCNKYYYDVTFRECSKNEVSSIKSTLYLQNFKSLLRTQMTLQQTIIISFVVIIISYVAFTLLKRNKKSKTEKGN